MKSSKGRNFSKPTKPIKSTKPTKPTIPTKTFQFGLFGANDWLIGTEKRKRPNFQPLS